MRGLFEGWHLIVLLVVVLLLFGSKRLPDAARGLGRSLRIFKSEVQEMKQDDNRRTPGTGGPGSTAAGSTTPVGPEPLEGRVVDAEREQAAADRRRDS